MFVAILLATCMGGASLAHAAAPDASEAERRSKGFVRGDVPEKFVADDRIQVRGLKIETVMYWEVWSLLGSPVRFCLIAYRIPQKSPVSVVHRDGTMSSDIPASVAKQVTLYDAEITARVGGRGPLNETFMACDGGAILAAADVGDAEWDRIQDWTAEQRRARFSFNTPESPEWVDLFHVGGEPRRPVPEATAKSLVKSGFRLEVPRGTWLGVTHAKVNLAPIHVWLAEQRKAKLQERAASLEKDERRRAAARKKRDASLKGAGLFWDAPENTELEADHQKRAQTAAGLRADEAQADKAIADAARQSKDAAAWVDRKHKEAEARPPPGGDLARAEHTLLSVLSARFRRSSLQRTLTSCVYERTDDIDQTLTREGLCRYAYRLHMDIEYVGNGRCDVERRSEALDTSAPIDFGTMNIRFVDGDLIFSERIVERESSTYSRSTDNELWWFTQTDDDARAVADAVRRLIELCPAAVRSPR